uniref:Uncharacterized protein n=1 Tax=Anguilla anguilla TaxID=7936 RepID=A0A0E9TV80_ANGAN
MLSPVPLHSFPIHLAETHLLISQCMPMVLLIQP